MRLEKHSSPRSRAGGQADQGRSETTLVYCYRSWRRQREISANELSFPTTHCLEWRNAAILDRERNARAPTLTDVMRGTLNVPVDRDAAQHG
ncbi:hypothetical protein EVAR_60645_1 [Eumeta japonica]|uniref:Uncharacterized protein n=1 Tax=Eumeta variegata TaxID=151549 RepID=A0A4C1ZP91_EUMVA|nr:hypothetical protein EVAR_60645_1 [Eumeta japonica]